MNQSDAMLVAKELAPVFQAMEARNHALEARIVALEARPVPSAPVSVRSGSIDRNNCLILTLSDGSHSDLGVVVGKDGRDGKDVDPGVIAGMVAAEVSKIPLAKDGSNGKDADPKDVAAIIKAEIAPQIEALEGSLGRLEAAAETKPVPDDGHRGIAEPEAIREVVTAEVGKAIAALPPAKDGKDADPAMIVAAVEKAVAALPQPQPGKDADPVLIRQMIDDAVAALPVPKDGESVTLDQVRPLVADAVAALPPPVSGRDADPEVIRQMVEEAVATLPPAEPGKSVDPAEVASMVAAEVKQVVAALPPAPAGEPGKSVTLDDVRPLVAEAVAAIPKPKDGVSVELDAVEAMVARAVTAMPKPLDGVGLAGALIDRAGHLVVTMTDGKPHDLGEVVGKGKDGVGFEDLSVDYDGERTITLRFSRGDQTKEFPIVMPVVLDRGVYKSGTTYEKGDGVTFGGSYWIAQRQTTDKPEISDAWRLATKRGRDGKDAVPTPNKDDKGGSKKS